MYRKEHLDHIIKTLAYLSKEVEIRSSLNLTDLNIHAEIFFRDLLNLALDLHLESMNSIDPNAKAIDLGDKINRIAIQVTSTSSLKKTSSTVIKFIENELDKEYDRLVILNLVKSSKHKDPLIGVAGKFLLDTKEDIWDCNVFARKISDKGTPSLEKVEKFLRKELKQNATLDQPKEVKTIIALIDHLSNCENLEVGQGYIEEPDPEGKILERFESHSEFLTQTYINLYKLYGPNLETIKKNLDVGTVQIEKKSLYLKQHSDRILNQNNNDPRKSLEILTQEYASYLMMKNIEYDETAITFFLVDELIRCNIFPNSNK
jgi:hypothetical protein